MHDELAQSVASCTGRIERALLADANLCEVDLCGEACLLHDCSDFASCLASCERAATTITDEQLRTIVLNAAKTPGLCTCDVCEPDSFGFCEAVWDCNMG
jgi:hypothetical protein